MEFSRELREDVISGAITVSFRLWRRPKVKEGGRYPVGPAHIEVDSVELVPFAASAKTTCAAPARRIASRCGGGRPTPARSATTRCSTGWSSIWPTRRPAEEPGARGRWRPLGAGPALSPGGLYRPGDAEAPAGRNRARSAGRPPLWSLHPAYTASPAAQYIPKPPGFSVTLRVLAGGQVEATTALRRQVTPPASVQTVRRDLASTLFAPPQARPGAPAIVVIGGSDGGEQTALADALALAGYPALALGCFKEPGLPQCLCGIPLEYFARAVGWLRAQPAARGRPVVLIGDSAGAEAALLIASYEPHLADAIVANSPSYLVTAALSGPPASAAWTFHGKPLTTGTLIPVADIRIPLVLSDGGQDLIWPSAPSATQIVQELRRSPDRAPYASL